ncbi:hypothetical protein AHAS_Ahas02G0043000 [Arachis hypogaea]
MADTRETAPARWRWWRRRPRGAQTRATTRPSKTCRRDCEPPETCRRAAVVRNPSRCCRRRGRAEELIGQKSQGKGERG